MGEGEDFNHRQKFKKGDKIVSTDNWGPNQLKIANVDYNENMYEVLDNGMTFMYPFHVLDKHYKLVSVPKGGKRKSRRKRNTRGNKRKR
jgi:hypothetical protein